MRGKTESGNVDSSHSSAWGRSSRSTNERIESRRASCSSVKMKCLRPVAWSGLRTVSVVAMAAKLPDRPGEVNSRTSYFPRGSAVGELRAERPQRGSRWRPVAVQRLQGRELSGGGAVARERRRAGRAQQAPGHGGDGLVAVVLARIALAQDRDGDAPR